MLKLIIYLILICNISMPTITVFASENFARAETTIYLYKTSTDNENISNIYCMIEKGYFVQILNEENNYYSVYYNGINGFVKKNDVKEIINTPNTPYPSNIQIIIGSDCNLRSSPTTNSNTNNIIATIKKDESNINFIGRIFSQEVIDFGGTVWYLIEYDGKTGYIYNKYVKSITPIYENNEKANYKNSINSSSENPLTQTPSLIIVLILFLPSIFLIFLLYLPRKLKKPSKISNDKY